MLSILYPENHDRSLVPINLETQQAAFKTLGCERLVGSKIANYFSDDPRVLAVRNELFAALIHYPELCSDLSDIGDRLNQIYETLDYMKKSASTPSLTYAVFLQPEAILPLYVILQTCLIEWSQRCPFVR